MSSAFDYAARFRQRFLEGLDHMPEDGCWEWQGVRFSQGYGFMRFEGTIFLAHRAAWFVHTWVFLPSETYVCHHCDNKPCVNIDHLFVGAPKDNAHDRSTKGGYWKTTGERHWSAKLNRESVLYIRASAGRISPNELAADFGVSRRTIRGILAREKWKHVQ